MPFNAVGKDAFALLAICLGALMFGLEITSVPVILPTLERLLDGDFKDMQWVMNAYTLACTTVLMATGSLADRFGRKRVFLASIAAFGTASALCGYATSMDLLIAGRFLQGLAGGAMVICSIALLSHQFQGPRNRGRAFATWGIVSGIGLGFGPLIGTAINAVAGWKWIFLINLPLAGLALAIAAPTVSESRDPLATRLDIAGILTLSLGLFGLTWVITQGPTLSPGIAIAVTLATAASFGAFLFAERRQAHPMFDFAVFRNPTFSAAILGCVAMNVSYWPFMIYLPVYLQAGLGLSPTATAACLLAYTLPTLVFPPLGERLGLRFGPGVVIPLGLFTIGAGFLAMTLGSGADRADWSTILPGLLLAGIGLGITNTPVTNTTTASVPSSRAGMASGIDMSARLVTLAVNIALMGFILVATIASTLETAANGASDLPHIRAQVEAIAAGNLAVVQGASTTAHQALADGFGMVMLYGGVSAWILAGFSLLLFRKAAASVSNVLGAFEVDKAPGSISC